MSKLAAALAWAARGFPVFPLEPNTKDPAFQGAWYDMSTTDPDRIRAMWVDPVTRIERDYNIGMDCTGRVVIDIDVKNGKDGYNEYAQLTANSAWDTLTVRTPSGGYHLYFEGDDVGNAPISPAVDVRSHHGYVVAPGSTIDGRSYEIQRDVEPAWLPVTLARYLAPVLSRKEFVRNHLDSDAAVQAAINYLVTTPPAIEGQRGDETTFIVAARLVRELGLSSQKAYELLCEYYNPRCVPPWSLDELHQKVENAENYGTADLGSIDPQVLFGGLNFPPPPNVFGSSSVDDWGNALEPASTPERPWLLDRMLIVGEVSMIVSPGAVGKSTLGLIIAAHYVMGANLGPYIMRGSGRALVYNGEDDKVEQSRRLQAICASYNFPYEKVRAGIKLVDDSDITLTLVQRAGSAAVVNEGIVSMLTNTLMPADVGLFVGDPLGDLHSVNEGEPDHMNTVVRTLKRISRDANVATLIMAHSTKGGSNEVDRAGNMDILRGTSATAYKARAVFTLSAPTAQDCEDYNLEDSERGLWARLDDAKMNLSLKGDNLLWFKREGIRISSGDVVGVLREQQLKKSAMYIKARIASGMADHLIATNTATMTITQAAHVVKNVEPLWANKTDTDVKQRLESLFAMPCEVNGRTIHVRRENDKLIVALS